MSDTPETFEAALIVTATAAAVHPEGTELDEHGHPITEEN